MPAEKQHPREMDKLTRSKPPAKSYIKQAKHAVDCLKSGRTKAQRSIAELKQRKMNLNLASQKPIHELPATEEQLEAAQVVPDVIEPRLEAAKADLQESKIGQQHLGASNVIRED